ncbi:MAG: YbbR-like domain-containing protein [Bacteroidota bacterium]
MLTFLRKIKIKNPLRDTSQEDRNAMALCLGIAFFFWLLVKLSNEYTVGRSSNVIYALPMGRAFASPPPAQVSFSLTAKGWDFFVAALSRRSYDLSYEVPDRTSFNLNAYQLQTDLEAEINNKDILITNLSFAGFSSMLEEQEQKKVPIIVTSKLSFADEYDLAAPIATQPDSVVVTGPASQLENTLYWPTDSLVLEALNDDFSGVLQLQIPQEGLRLAQKEVAINIEVERFTEKSIFVPIELINPTGDSIRIFPDKALVKCVIGLGHYNTLTADDFVLVAEVGDNEINVGKSTMTLALKEQPDYLRSVLISPRSVEFFLIQESSSENQ